MPVPVTRKGGRGYTIRCHNCGTSHEREAPDEIHECFECMDWVARFMSLEPQEQRYDIQMLECYLPDPWYRTVAYGFWMLSMFGGLGLLFLALLCTTTQAAAVFVPMAVGGLVLFSLQIPLIAWYDNITGDVSLLLDKKGYRDENEQRGLFQSHSDVNRLQGRLEIEDD